MVSKQFRVAPQDRTYLDFELVFQRLINDEWVEQTEKFKARSTVPGNLLLSMTAAINAGQSLQAHEMMRMLHQSISKEDEERFFDLLDDPDTAIPLETLGEILEWLAEQYVGRPT
jgi:hypothetical protein